MRTSIGNFLRELRIKKGETLKDMAEKLGVSSAFLSAVENGKKKIPESWSNRLKAIYSLDTNQVSLLKTAIIESSDLIELNVANVSTNNRRLAVTFARYFETLDESTANKIFEVLKNNSEK